MDSLITAAARSLSMGDPLSALNFLALRDDPPALALRGIAMAQLGDLARAKTLLRRAARAFGPREAVARARCVVAEAEIALVSRDLGWPAKPRDSARTVLERHGDRANAAHARYLAVRRLLLIGRLDQAERLTASTRPRTAFILVPRHGRDVAVLAPHTDEEHATVLALLPDGEAWSSSALALALGASQRTVQRALDDLKADGKSRQLPMALRVAGWRRRSRFPVNLVTPGCAAWWLG